MHFDLGASVQVRPEIDPAYVRKKVSVGISASCLRSTYRFSPNGNFGRIATKRCDVVLDPLQPKSLISKTQICAAVRLQFASREEAKSANSVVDCYE